VESGLRFSTLKLKRRKTRHIQQQLHREHISDAAFCFAPRSPLFEIASVLVCLDHVARSL
jgi:hypothetical protein